MVNTKMLNFIEVIMKYIVWINYHREYLQNFPVWSIVSFLQKSYTSEDEFILSADGNGSVRKWSIVSNSYNIGKW